MFRIKHSVSSFLTLSLLGLLVAGGVSGATSSEQANARIYSGVDAARIAAANQDCAEATVCADGTTVSCTSSGYSCSTSVTPGGGVTCIGYNEDGSYKDATIACP